MSILGSIFSKIITHSKPAAPSAPTPDAPPAQAPTPQVPTSTPTPPNAGATTTASSSAPPTQPAMPPASVDAASVLSELAKKNSQTLDWQHSIVDMMKLLDLDSSLSARQTLAKELHYTGDMQDSAAMNIWLHSEVMKKLSQNGGKMPADLAA